MRAEVGVALEQRLQEHVGALAARRASAALLGRIQTLVGEPQGALDVARLGRQVHRAVRAVDPPTLAVVGERLDRGGEDLVDGSRSTIDQDAELVASQAVAVARRRGRGEPGAEATEQRIPGRVAERVVVVLEPVEVVGAERQRARLVRARQQPGEIRA